MEIIADRLDWTSVDEENLSKFLDTETGRRFLPKLLESVPALLHGGHVNAILIRNGVVAGYQEVARTILFLAHPPTLPSVVDKASAYPRLENDAEWADGQKLDPEPEPKS